MNCQQFSGTILKQSVIGALFLRFKYMAISPVVLILYWDSRLFGFDLMRNFNFPYFSRDIAEFWHLFPYPHGLGDYLYIPLG
jgi:D-alanyl-lipoteichoic acid acyltransferase DltB (MBOAT superfamily)